MFPIFEWSDFRSPLYSLSLNVQPPCRSLDLDIWQILTSWFDNDPMLDMSIFQISSVCKLILCFKKYGKDNLFSFSSISDWLKQPLDWLFSGKDSLNLFLQQTQDSVLFQFMIVIFSHYRMKGVTLLNPNGQFRCCAHLKAGQNTFWGRFQPFLLISNIFHLKSRKFF